MSLEYFYLFSGVVLFISVSIASGYRWGMESERHTAVKHELAEWIPSDDGSPRFIWKTGLPERLSVAESELKHWREEWHRLYAETKGQNYTAARKAVEALENGEGK